MKRNFLAGLLATAFLTLAHGQPAFYINDGVVQCPPQIPPQIDALNFVNNNYFSVNFTNLGSQLFDTSDTLNFTNRGVMLANNGFRFDTAPSGSGLRRMAANFNNSGHVSAGAALHNTNAYSSFFAFAGVLPRLLISATNVVVTGTNTAGADGLIRVTGKNLNLNRGNLTMEGFGIPTNTLSAVDPLPECLSPGITNEPGIFDLYWSAFGVLSGSQIDACVNFGTQPVRTPEELVETFPGGSTRLKSLQLPNAVSYVDETFLDTSNRIVRVVFLSNTNPAIANRVYFRPFSEFLTFANGHTVVEWIAPTTNSADGSSITNHLYLFENLRHGYFVGNIPERARFFRFCTNVTTTNGLVANAIRYAQQPQYRPTFRPMNFTFFERRVSQASLLGPPSSPSSFSFNCLPVFVMSSAYGARFSPTTAIQDHIPGGILTNLPGRIELEADSVLDLTRARINSLNYLGLTSTNHFAGSTRAAISTPWSDISLATTNGMLAITNLLAPTVPRLAGDVEVWSGAWADILVDFSGVPLLRSEYHVLFVDSRLSATAPSQIQDLTLRSLKRPGSNNIVISDVLNVTRNLLLETEHLTITTNSSASVPSAGELNIVSPDIVWSTSTPRLETLTNNGYIRANNAVFFGGSRGEPFYSSTYNEPYEAMVNRGQIYNAGALIWADYFENTGHITPGMGSITLEAGTALLMGGNFPVPNGDIIINSGTLVVSNHTLQAGRVLNLTVPNLLDDGSLAGLAGAATNVGTLFTDPTSALLYTSVAGMAGKNTWTVGDSFSLLTRPQNASLLGTTVSAALPPGREMINYWSAADLGCLPSGFNNNAALGRLILDGGYDSLFTFAGTGGNNALYVDHIELSNFATNQDSGGNYIGLNPEANLNIYFAQATANGASIAEKLDGRYGVNGASGGRFCWVQNFAGFYSSTNLIYPDGTTNTFNAALVGSCNLDSDNDGLVNCSDPTPIQRPQDLSLAVAMVAQPTPRAEVSWRSLPNAANYLYYKDSFGATNWLLLTNFTSGPFGGRVSVTDPIKPASPRYYRVRVDSSQP